MKRFLAEERVGDEAKVNSIDLWFLLLWKVNKVRNGKWQKTCQFSSNALRRLCLNEFNQTWLLPTFDYPVYWLTWVRKIAYFSLFALTFSILSKSRNELEDVKINEFDSTSIDSSEIIFFPVWTIFQAIAMKKFRFYRRETERISFWIL